MRKWVPLLLAVALLPVCAAPVSAQSTGPGEGRNRAARVMDAKDMPVQQAQAEVAALAEVRNGLAAGKLSAWSARSGGTLRTSALVVAGSQFRQTDAKDATPVWRVGVTAPNATGFVRVEINARTGKAINGLMVQSGSWSAAWSN